MNNPYANGVKLRFDELFRELVYTHLIGCHSIDDLKISVTLNLTNHFDKKTFDEFGKAIDDVSRAEHSVRKLLTRLSKRTTNKGTE